MYLEELASVLKFNNLTNLIQEKKNPNPVIPPLVHKIKNVCWQKKISNKESDQPVLYV